MQTSEQTNIRTNCRWDRTSFRHFDPFARVSFLRKFCSYIPVKMGGSPVNTYQTGFWFWNKNGHDTQTHNDPLNQTGTCLFVGTCRNHGSVGLRTYGFVETLGTQVHLNPAVSHHFPIRRRPQNANFGVQPMFKQSLIWMPKVSLRLW